MFMAPGTEILIQMMSDLSYPFPELVERTYITSSYDEYNSMTKTNVLEKDSVYCLYQKHFVISTTFTFEP